MKPCSCVQVDIATIPTMASVMETIGDLRDAVKCGEGSYGEAFRLGRWVGSSYEGSFKGSGWLQNTSLMHRVRFLIQSPCA